MNEFVNTIDILGDEAAQDALLEGTFTEFAELRLTELRGHDALSYMPSLTRVSLPLLKGGGANIQAHFRANPTLKYVDLPRLENAYYGYFENCSSIEQIRLPALKIFSQYLFKGCTSLTALILPNRFVVCSCGSTNCFENTPIANGTGYIYVPRHFIDEYKAATNWSAYAAQFRVLQDYTVDGTIDGELDESKI